MTSFAKLACFSLLLSLVSLTADSFLFNIISKKKATTALASSMVRMLRITDEETLELTGCVGVATKVDVIGHIPIAERMGTFIAVPAACVHLTAVLDLERTVFFVAGTVDVVAKDLNLLKTLIGTHGIIPISALTYGVDAGGKGDEKDNVVLFEVKAEDLLKVDLMPVQLALNAAEELDLAHCESVTAVIDEATGTLEQLSSIDVGLSLNVACPPLTPDVLANVFCTKLSVSASLFCKSRRRLTTAVACNLKGTTTQVLAGVGTHDAEAFVNLLGLLCVGVGVTSAPVRVVTSLVPIKASLLVL